LFIESPNLFDNNKILVGDTAYDGHFVPSKVRRTCSKKLETKVNDINLGRLLRSRNPRNIKNKNKIYKPALKEKIILKRRINVEQLK